MSRAFAPTLVATDKGFVPWTGPIRPSFVPFNANDPGLSATAPDMVDESLAEVREAAYAEGFSAARANIEAELAAERVAVARLTETLNGLKPEPAGPLALLLVETVDRLVRQVVGEVAIDPNLLLARAHAAAELVTDEVKPSSLRLNPGDHARIGNAPLPLPAVSDPSVAPGSVLVETASGWIEDGIAARLDAVRAALMRIDG